MLKLIICTFKNNKFDQEKGEYLKLLEILKVIDPHSKPVLERNDETITPTIASAKSGKESSLGKSKVSNKH